MKNLTKFVLITGGAGFIGRAVSRALISKGVKVRILDNFSPQIHKDEVMPTDLMGSIEIIKADVRDRHALKKALSGIDGILHLAAETGTGQSMYEIEKYFDVNVQGTATLLDVLQDEGFDKNIKNFVVASSRAVYGEGAYICTVHGMTYPNQRLSKDIANGIFNPLCPICGAILDSVPTPESAPFMPASIYGLTKQVQEQAVLLFSRTRGINGFGLRYQNVYGPGQSLINPYTGILAVFSNLARQNSSIDIYEDGLESRDFIYIDDVVEATVQAVTFEGAFVGALNIGSGHATSVIDVANQVKNYFNSSSSINVTGAFRVGDIRHNVADLSISNRLLNFSPKTIFTTGLSNFLGWASDYSPEDSVAYKRSVDELTKHGLMVK